MNAARFFAIFLFVTCLASAVAAAWPDDPLVNIPVSLAPGTKSDVFAVTDGAGGVIIAWEDERGADNDIYVQRVSSDGETLWQTDGVAVCTATGDQDLYHSSTSTTGFTPLVADGTGGVWIVWQDARAFGSRLRDVYAQHVDADGNMLLVVDGVAVAAAAGMEDQPTACSDGVGGVIVAWQDKNTNPVFYDIHAQRLDAAGQPQWNDGESVPVVVWDWDQDGPSICADGTGGAFVAWSDGRDDVSDIYAQRLDATGDLLWTENGVAVCVAAGGQDAVTVQPATDGGVLLAWVDRRTGSPDIYGEKLEVSAGGSLWMPGGKPICTAPESQYRPALCSDDTGGAIVAWFDYRDASGPPWNLDIYAQRIMVDGSVAWPLNGVAVCAAPDAQRNVDLAADGQGGAFLAWEDNRLGTGREDIYAQRLDAAGQPAWAVDGRAVCTAVGNQERPDVVVGAGGMIAAWPDDRDVLYEADVYCDRVADDPTAAPELPVTALAIAVTGSPERGLSTVSFTLPHTAVTTVEVFDVRGRRVRVLVAARIRAAGTYQLLWDHRDQSGRSATSGVYLVRVTAGGEAAVARVVVIR